jgi:hypothetical protein
VLGHGRLRHTKLTLDLSNRLLRRDQQAQYRAAVWLRMTSKTASTLLVYSTEHMLVKVYKGRGSRHRFQPACVKT